MPESVNADLALLEIPEGWQSLSFGDATLELPRSRPSIPRGEYKLGGRYPIVDQGVAQIAGFTDNELAVYSEELPVIVFGDHTRVFKFVDFPFATGADGTKLIRARNEKLEPRFLYFALRNLDVPGRGYNRHYKLLREARLFAPTEKNEQRAIAGFLSKLQGAVDVETDRVVELKELKASTMRKLFLEGLRGEQSKETELGEIPKSWAVVPLGRVCRIMSGGTPSRDEQQYWGGAIPWVKTGEINYRTITETEEAITTAGLAASAAKVFPVGTLLMAMYGQGVTRGKVARLGIEATTNQACAAFFPDETRLTSEFLYAYFSHSYERLREAGHGANQKNLSADLLKGFLVPIPDHVSEQRAIFEVLDAFDRALETAEGRRRALDELFTSTLHLMMAGELRVGPLADVFEEPHE